ncbi:hypothetical protein [Streptomyces sp. SID8352]|uniref:hypothetical protein n=1 Tax=Streptomyces sp. SID8352 TaxID=2690338 RepID=UPI001369F807|nr:hypothetical protein [Streptomyces sp. SID8352]MYU24820.1 hypothetical protein [Streptomyces sp. SID8352]
MTDTVSLDHHLREHPLCAAVIAQLPEPPDGTRNDLCRVLAARRDTPLHWATLVRWIDLSLDPQVTGYSLGVARFPRHPDARPYRTMADLKLWARQYWREAEESMRKQGAPFDRVPPPNAQGLSMPWYFLWLGATANAASSGIGLWTGMLLWHQFSAAMVRTCDDRPDSPPALRYVFARFEEYPTELMNSCLDLGEAGLAAGESAADAVTVAAVGMSSLNLFLSECVK